MSVFLIILAAGDSKRLGLSTPKPFVKINNKTLLEYSIDTFQNFHEIKKIIITYNSKNKKYLNSLRSKNIIKVKGGKTRQESVFKALKRIEKMNCKKIIIHDSARPNVDRTIVRNLLRQLRHNDAVIPIIKTNDATKREKQNIIFKNIQRESLRFAQTPQGFTYKKIYQKHKENINLSFDDDSALFTEYGGKVTTINGSKKNLKITDKEDLEIFKSLKRKMFIGIGFDIHKLVKKRKLYLGGIKIPFNYGLEGHSDADPVLHALIDSLLGACRLGDIGKLFPNKNKKYKGIRSTILLGQAIKLIKSRNFLINNIDINIITQKPKIKKYSREMIKTISAICEIDPNQINIKGKTAEKLGLIGKGKAIACEASVSVIKYDW